MFVHDTHKVLLSFKFLKRRIVMTYQPCNPNASKEVIHVLNYLHKISGKGIITGQHTKTKAQDELTYIQKVTGKLPGLCGFELLAYSPNINYENSDEACLKEVRENKGTLEEAWAWAEKKGLITLDRKSTRLNSSHVAISYAVFCLNKNKAA